MPPSLFQVLKATTYIGSASAATASSARIYRPTTLHPCQPGHSAMLNETAWSALVGMRKREARDAAKAELAAE